MQIAIRLFSLIILCSLGLSPISAQSAKKKADKFYKQKDYQKAYDEYIQIKNIQKDKVSLAKKGIASYHINKLTEASKDITAAYKMGNSAPELKFYMGRINHSMRKYEDAIFFYKSYLRELKANEEIQPDVALYIKNCFAGMRLSYDVEELGLVENAGNLINSKDDEINPVPSPSIVNRFYYSSNRAQDNFDLFSAELLEATWHPGHHIHESLNTAENEILQDCSIDGSVLVFLRGDQKGSNRLYLNRYSESKHNQRVVFSETKAVTGDQDVYLINDETMIFASNREGGYGGYDLYISEFSPAGWTTPRNLGQEINSSYDERYPFMLEDGSELFFSSNNPKSIGGFDIFSSTKTLDGWSDTKPYAYPINSPEDDIQFRIQEEGFQAYISSNRKSSTIGGFDIYTIFLRKAVDVHTSEPKQPLSLIRSSVKDEDYAYEEEDERIEEDSKKLEQEKMEQERLEQERLEQEMMEKEKMEQEALEKERMEQERLEKERLEQERLEKERLEQERLEQERLEQERLEQERLEQERLEKERMEQERLAKEKMEKERLEKERLEQERLEQERLEKERLEKERLEQERLEKERMEQERLEKERMEQERLEKEKMEQERLEKERLEQERLEKERMEQERLAKEKMEQERLEKERMEQERLEKERLEEEARMKESVATQVSDNEGSIQVEKQEEEIEIVQPKKEERRKRKRKGEEVTKDITAISLRPITYTSDSELLSEENKEILDGVITKLNASGQSKIILTSHTLPEGLPEFELMFAIKRAEKISDYIVASGVDPTRIILNGVGSAYPFVKKVVDADLYESNKVYNNRIDIKLVNISGNSVVDQPSIDEKLLSPKYQIFQTVTEDVYFRVFIHSTEKKMYKNAILRYYNDLLIENDLQAGLYKYYVGLYTDFKSAFELKRELENRNVAEASIVAYYNGNILSLSDAKILKGQYPELVNYIEINQ